MTFCVKCGTKLDNGAVFCTGCGTPVQSNVNQGNQLKCVQCGANLDANEIFCTKCGTKVAPKTDEPAQNESQNTQKPAEKIICAGCSKELEPDWVICPFCNKKPKRTTCSKCGKKLDQKWVVCPYCNTAIEEE